VNPSKCEQLSNCESVSNEKVTISLFANIVIFFRCHSDTYQIVKDQSPSEANNAAINEMHHATRLTVVVRDDSQGGGILSSPNLGVKQLASSF
jgi:hypothetical protein